MKKPWSSVWCRLGVGLLVLCLAGWLWAQENGTSGGRLAGTVRVEGTLPEKRPVPIPANLVDVCGRKAPDESVVVGEMGLLANVVISVEGVATPETLDRSRTAVLDNKDCRFEPHVQAVLKRQEIRVTNSDPVFHNVHAYRGDRTIFNMALPVGSEGRQKLRQPGIHLMTCDAGHTWMRAYVAVFDHPYFAVTSEDGRFEIPALPPGTYTLRAWHETFGKLEQKVTIQPGEETPVELTFTSDE